MHLKYVPPLHAYLVFFSVVVMLFMFSLDEENKNYRIVYIYRTDKTRLFGTRSLFSGRNLLAVRVQYANHRILNMKQKRAYDLKSN